MWPQLLSIMGSGSSQGGTSGGGGGGGGGTGGLLPPGGVPQLSTVMVAAKTNGTCSDINGLPEWAEVTVSWTTDGSDYDPSAWVADVSGEGTDVSIATQTVSASLGAAALTLPGWTASSSNSQQSLDAVFTVRLRPKNGTTVVSTKSSDVWKKIYGRCTTGTGGGGGDTGGGPGGAV